MKGNKIDVLRITTVSLSLEKLLVGQMSYMQEKNVSIATASYGQFDFENHYQITSLRRAISPVRDFLALLEIYKLIKRLKPAIVHTHTPKAGLLGMWAARLAGVKCRIHTVAGMPLMAKAGWMKKLLIWMEKLTYAAATDVWPNSFGLKKFIEQNIYAGKKLDVIGRGTSNGINLNYFSKDTVSSEEVEVLRNNLGLEGTVFIFIGRLVGDKGITELIKAYEAVYRHNQDISLLLVGSEEPDLDPLPLDIKSSIETNKSIVSVGFQQDVRPYIAVSDVLIFPSYREGFPNVPLQCGAFAKALVLSDINGCNEIVSDESLGILVEVKDEKALQSAMLNLLGNKKKRTKLGLNVQKHIAANFEQSVIWQELVRRYKVVLS